MQGSLIPEGRGFLSAAIAGRREARSALAAVTVSAGLFIVAMPFATIPLTPVHAFIPAYESALVICDLITAVLLFSQFSVLGSRAVYVLAAGYLFTAFIAFAHALTFPDVFSPTGLLGAKSQTTAWLYMFWHGGFPLFVIVYALLKGDGRKDMRAEGTVLTPPASGSGIAILCGVAGIFALVCGVTLVATASSLPVLIFNNRFTWALTTVVAGIWLLSLVALVILWRRRPYTLLDVWLMVVMCAWMFDVALSAVLNAGRFDLGWYSGRMYGLLAASFLLIVLLVETSTHYARLVQLSAALGTANKRLEQLSLHDELTQLANRRFFDSYLAGQIAIARRHKRTLALVLCDVDAFKAYNDHYGHQAGDECLKKVAVALRSCCRRPADMAARYGGEEFALIFPDTELAGAMLIAEAARDAVKHLRIPHQHSPVGPYVTISGGVAVLIRTIELTAEQLIKAADQALFEAKTLGRNRMISVRAEAEKQEASHEPLPSVDMTDTQTRPTSDGVGLAGCPTAVQQALG